ncbi:MAG: methyltransferase domain-containing protein [Chitinivibrionales bacterium]|nr:methyltransferase domain-containing protein [Chitinivibrionales bacterium]
MTQGRGRHPARIRMKKPDQALLDRYMLVWSTRELHFHTGNFPPVTSQSIFGTNALLILDIGSATGELSHALAADHPDFNILGIEISTKPIWRSLVNAHRKNLHNVKYLKTDFRLLYPLMQPDSVQAAYLHFPVPVLTGADEKHAIFSERFLDALHIGLVDQGVIGFTSDNEHYFSDVAQRASQRNDFRLLTDKKECEAAVPLHKSYYHDVWERQGRLTQRFVLLNRK